MSGTEAAGGLPRDELAAWLRLLETPGIGRLGARRLLRAFGTPQQVFDAGASAWRDAVGPAEARAQAEPPAGLDA